ncbi:putative dimethylamine corrinoid protein [Desulfitobacterium hafniense DP7]|uniref:Putative dimethylamine corrinoid protein n=1 Tax=Desulfitobacterium hafniense DP7 TaxID=537010 RepID=G9XGQ5_DESHA|nr:corrinoid protein [Desulfitobacterium hafniense]EHL09090.1 putative dimethylamine corrinoid protein [Desulfitobacterium hafniense DP7]
MTNFESLNQSVVSGDEAQVIEQVKAFMDAGVSPLEIINQGLIGGMNIVGPRFKAGDMFVPEVLMAARAMAAGVNIVKPFIADNDLPSKGKILLGTVKGDLHDIGKNLVGMMLESSGFKVIDLGIDIPADRFVAAIKEHKPDILAMSALLTTTMQNMKDTVDLVKEAGVSVKCIVGGAPVSQEFADQIGAAGYAPDAASAVDLCNKLLSA